MTLRVDQGRVTAAAADSISIQRNDGEAVTVPVDGDTKVWGRWWRHKHDDVKASHKRDRDDHDGDDGFTAADIPVGKRVLVARTDGDPAAEWISAGGKRHHGWRDRDDD